MRIAVMGVGGIGGVVGGRLAAAGADVLFIARGAHLAALQSSGLRVSSALGDVHLPRVHAKADVAGEAPADVILFTVKGPDALAAAETIAPLVASHTAIVPFMNGVEHVDILERRFGRGAVLPGVTYIAAVIAEPGRVQHVGNGNRSLFGETDGTLSARGRRFADLATTAGLDMQLVPNILEALWSKFVLLGAFTAVASLSRLPVGIWTKEPETHELFVEGMHEIIAVAARRGIKLDVPKLIEANLAFMRSLEPPWKGSMLNDLERGKRIEVDSLSGYVHRLGRELGVETPLHSTAYRALCHFAK